jgi:hypothetical protein
MQEESPYDERSSEHFIFVGTQFYAEIFVLKSFAHSHVIRRFISVTEL